MSFFNSLQKIVSESFVKKEKSVVAVDFGISSVKVVQLRKERGRAVLETYGELATGPYSDLSVGQATNLPIEKLVQLLNDLLREANVTTRTGAIAIPLRNSLIVSIEIPQVDEDKMGDIIPIEARKYVPVPISEVMLDWWVIPKNSADDGLPDNRPTKEESQKPVYGRKMEVLIASIHKDTIRLYQEVSNKIGLNVNNFEIETFSSIRSVMPNDLSATAILDIGAGTSKIAIVDYGIVRLSHTIDKGSQDITVAISSSLGIPFGKAEEIKRKIGLVGEMSDGNLLENISPTVEYIFAEAGKVMLNYQKEHKRSIDKVVLIGGGSLLKGILEVAQKVVEVPVVLGSPFDKVETPAFMEKILRQAGPEFAVALGLALRKLEDL